MRHWQWRNLDSLQLDDCDRCSPAPQARHVWDVRSSTYTEGKGLRPTLKEVGTHLSFIAPFRPERSVTELFKRRRTFPMQCNCTRNKCPAIKETRQSTAGHRLMPHIVPSSTYTLHVLTVGLSDHAVMSTTQDTEIYANIANLITSVLPLTRTLQLIYAGL